MTQDEFVYRNIYEGCVKQGVDHALATTTAQEGLQAYREHRYFKKPLDLILDKIDQARKISNASKKSIKQRASKRNTSNRVGKGASGQASLGRM